MPQPYTYDTWWFNGRMAQKLTGINSTPTLNHCPSALHKFLPSDHEVFFLFSFVFYQLVRYYVLPKRRTQFQECSWQQYNKFKTFYKGKIKPQNKSNSTQKCKQSLYKDVRTTIRNMNLVKKPNTWTYFQETWFLLHSLKKCHCLNSKFWHHYSRWNKLEAAICVNINGLPETSNDFTEILEDTREL